MKRGSMKRHVNWSYKFTFTYTLYSKDRVGLWLVLYYFHYFTDNTTTAGTAIFPSNGFQISEKTTKEDRDDDTTSSSVSGKHPTLVKMEMGYFGNS